MEKYTGTKEIKAKPMSRGDYNILRGWAIPANEDPKEEGYLVEYEPNGKPNLEGYEGYVSWSPKDVFEKAYQPSETFLDRLENEYIDLSNKYYKLNSFINSAKFRDIVKDDESAELLIEQEKAMYLYKNILLKRIRLILKLDL